MDEEQFEALNSLIKAHVAFGHMASQIGSQALLAGFRDQLQREVDEAKGVLVTKPTGEAKP